MFLPSLAPLLLPLPLQKLLPLLLPLTSHVSSGSGKFGWDVVVGVGGRGVLIAVWIVVELWLGEQGWILLVLGKDRILWLGVQGWILLVSGKGTMLWLGEQGCILLVSGEDKMLVLGCCGEDKGVKPILIVLMSLFLLIILVFGSFAAAAGCLPAVALLLALPPPLLSISTSVVVSNVSPLFSSLLGRLTGVGGGPGRFSSSSLIAAPLGKY